MLREPYRNLSWLRLSRISTNDRKYKPPQLGQVAVQTFFGWNVFSL
jgi:hypothetical protein